MPMVCPQCHSSFEQAQECPTCGVRLFYKASRTSAADITTKPVESWQESQWGRIFLGLLLAQGLYYGLWHLSLAAKAALTVPELLMQQAVQILSLILGGALAGAGQRRGVLNGAVVGVWNVMLYFVYKLVDRSLSDNPHELVAVYGQPILHAFFGALGGFIGKMLWKPLPAPYQGDLLGLPPALPTPVSMGSVAAPLPTIQPVRPVPSAGEWLVAFVGPLAWGRILLGTALTVVGTFSASRILDFVLTITETRKSYISDEQSQLMTWEVFVLVMVAGSAVAGASRNNGAKQGLCVGLITGVLLIFLHATGILGSRSQPAHTLVFKLLGLLSAFPTPLETAPYTILSTLLLGMIGGWFGSILLPPINRTKPERIR